MRRSGATAVSRSSSAPTTTPRTARCRRRARDWRRSSTRAHLAGKDDGLVRVRPLLALAPDWPGFLAEGLAAADHEAIRAGERTGRPLGSVRFVGQLEKRLARRKPEPKPKAERPVAKINFVSAETMSPGLLRRQDSSDSM